MPNRENIVSATKMFLNLLGNIFASWKANFMFPQQSFPRWTNREILIRNVMFPKQCFLVCPGLSDKHKNERLGEFQFVSNVAMNCGG